MSDLGISHIVIGRKSDRGAVSLELYSRVLGHQHIERRRICLRNGVALSLRSKPDTVHDYRKNRTCGPFEFAEFFKLHIFISPLYYFLIYRTFYPQ